MVSLILLIKQQNHEQGDLRWQTLQCPEGKASGLYRAQSFFRRPDQGCAEDGSRSEGRVVCGLRLRPQDAAVAGDQAQPVTHFVEVAAAEHDV
jgi:hypothetical protein